MRQYTSWTSGCSLYRHNARQLITNLLFFFQNFPEPVGGFGRLRQFQKDLQLTEYQLLVDGPAAALDDPAYIDPILTTTGNRFQHDQIFRGATMKRCLDSKIHVDRSLHNAILIRRETQRNIYLGPVGRNAKIHSCIPDQLHDVVNSRTDDPAQLVEHL